MSAIVYPRFLVDAEEYQLSERCWRDLWCEIDSIAGPSFGWTSPWLIASARLRDGNPIFTAVSPKLRRGIRVIQEDPIDLKPEFCAWLDTFGGDITDPDAIHELVISCTLSAEATGFARSLFLRWVRAESIRFTRGESGLLLPSAATAPAIVGIAA